MVEKENIFETEVMSLPPLRLGVGVIPVLNPNWQHNASQRTRYHDPKLEATVRRIIAYLKDEK